MAERGEPLSGENLSQLYLSLVRQFYGHDQGVCRVDELYGAEWAFVPHFYYDFYVFQYATSMVASTAVANTIREEVAFAPEMMELPKEEADALVKEALETFHLDGHEDDYTLSLPEDLKTYLSIASIYPLKPQILLIDEPTTGLDTHGERTMMDSLCRLRDAGHTLVIITHNMKTVARYCDRAIVMSQGEIVMDAPVREVYGQPERLLEADIRPPQITRLGQDLKDLGLPQDVLTVDEMARVLTHNLLNEG
jgi:ABC-type uncharacterized transport system ATPase subunit